MAKVYKVSMYITDYNEYFQGGENLKDNLEVDLQFDDFNTNHIEIEESEKFEWDDDLKINYTSAMKEDFEAYFKKIG